jgi:hypothetical protein
MRRSFPLVVLLVAIALADRGQDVGALTINGSFTMSR